MQVIFQNSEILVWYLFMQKHISAGIYNLEQANLS